MCHFKTSNTNKRSSCKTNLTTVSTKETVIKSLSVAQCSMAGGEEAFAFLRKQNRIRVVIPLLGVRIKHFKVPQEFN